MEKKLKIQRVSSEFLGRVIEHRVPLGLFLAKEGGLWVRFQKASLVGRPDFDF